MITYKKCLSFSGILLLTTLFLMPSYALSDFKKQSDSLKGLKSSNGLKNNAKVSYQGTLEVKFTGIKNSQGKICFNLFNGPKGFPDGGKGANLKEARCIPIQKGTAKISLANLPYGTYAISAVHDTNGDNRLNSNFIGIPSEGVGISNNPNIQMGSPSFSESQFLLSGAITNLQIQVKYFN